MTRLLCSTHSRHSSYEAALLYSGCDGFTVSAASVRKSPAAAPLALRPPNTPGDAESLFCISRSGNYFLADDVEGVCGKHGIKITASNVTLDLRGNRLVGVAGSLDGIHCGQNKTVGITVRNGALIQWGRNGVTLLGKDHRLCEVRSLCNELNGAVVESATVDHCTFSRNADDGFLALESTTVSECMADGNGGYGFSISSGSKIENCSAAGNHGGFYVVGSSAASCAAEGNQFYGFVTKRAKLDECSAILTAAGRKNTGTGFYLQDCTIARHCSANDNQGSGYYEHGGSVTVDCKEVGNDCPVALSV